jgi:hypothetical protein
MQIFIDLDLRRAVQGPGDRTPISPIQCSSQDTLEMDVYYVRGANVVNPGPGIALKFGLFDPNSNVVALQSGWQQLQDTNYNQPYWEGLIVLNTTQMATAMQNITSAGSLACNGELRYQLSDGEIIHTIYLPFIIFPALLQETGTPPVTVQNTYPDASTLLLTSMKGVAGGVAELDANKLLNPAEEPIDNRTIVISNGKMAVPIDGQTLVIQNGKLVVPIDGQTIVLKNGVLETGFILTTFAAAWTTVGPGATTPSILVGDATKLVNGQAIRVPVAGYYIVTIVDATHVTLTNNSDPFNTGAGVTIPSGTVILPAQLATSGGGSVSLAIGTVTTLAAGAAATASITGTSPNFTLNLGLPPGHDGISPATPTLTIGSVSTLPAGSAATASITGTYPNFTLNLGIPAGQSGGGSGGGGGVTSLSDVDTTAGDLNIVYDGPTGKLKGLRFDPLFNATDAGQFLNIPFPAFPRIQAGFTMPAVGSNTPSINIQNQGTNFLQPGMLIYISGAGVLQVVSTATASGQDSAIFQNVGSTQTFTNAVAGATINAGAWIEILQQSVVSLTDASTDVSTGAFSLIGASTGKVKKIWIPAWLQPTDDGTEVKINAPTPLGAGDMKVAVYDTISGNSAALPAAQVDQARILVQPRTNQLRNFIDNGLFKVHQRGSFLTAVAASGVQIDRFKYNNVTGTAPGAFTLTASENLTWAIIGSDNPYPNAGVQLNTSTIATPGAGEAYLYQHTIEGPNYRDLVLSASAAWQYLTFRFFVTASWSGVTYPMYLGVSFYNPSSGSYYVTDAQINSASPQEIIITLPADAGNAVSLSPGTVGLVISFCLGAGSAYRAAAATTAWTAGGPKYGTNLSTNFVAITGALLRFNELSLNVGRQPMKLFGYDYGEDLRRCQRFYCKSCIDSLVPGAAGLQNNAGMFYVGATTAAYGNVRFPVDMYAAPTVKVYDSVNGGASGTGFVGSGTVSGLTPTWINTKGFSNIGGSGLTVGQVLQVAWEASADI